MVTLMDNVQIKLISADSGPIKILMIMTAIEHPWEILSVHGLITYGYMNTIWLYRRKLRERYLFFYHFEVKMIKREERLLRAWM